MAVDVVVVVPEEIIKQEILIRLPIKSLVRFRCVCKSWNSQLYNLDYLSLFSRNPKRDNDDYLIFMSNNYTTQDIVPRGLYILTGVKSSINNVPFPLSFSKLHDDIHLIASVNGLVCMAFYFEDDHEHVFILWNPTIRLYKTILVPANDLGLRSSFAEEDFLYGFGWDSVTNDYKIIIKPLTGRSSPASVYSSKTDCWSNNDSARSIVINSVFRDKKCEPTCVIVNGSPYWKSYWKDSNIVLKFDVTSNEFTSLKPPSGCFNYSLINLNDCLALIDYGNWSTQGVVYSFDEERSIWVQMYTICKRNLSLRSHCFTYNGGIMFHEKRCWYWYDLMSHELKSCTPFDNCGRSLGNGFSYTLSLVALPGMKVLHMCET